MKNFKFEKVKLDKSEKIKVAICASLIFLCTFVSIGFLIFTLSKIESIDIDTFTITFICTYIGILVITFPSALIFSKTMKQARTKQSTKENAEV